MFFKSGIILLKWRYFTNDSFFFGNLFSILIIPIQFWLKKKKKQFRGQRSVQVVSQQGILFLAMHAHKNLVYV